METWIIVFAIIGVLMLVAYFIGNLMLAVKYVEQSEKKGEDAFVFFIFFIFGIPMIVWNSLKKKTDG